MCISDFIFPRPMLAVLFLYHREPIHPDASIVADGPGGFVESGKHQIARGLCKLGVVDPVSALGCYWWRGEVGGAAPAMGGC